MVSDRDRHDLFVALHDRLGPGPPDTMMELLPSVGWADVARSSGLAALRIDLRAEMAELRAELRGQMAELRAELRGESAELRGEMSGLRGEMSGLPAELKADLKSEVASLRNQLFAANVATAATVAGLVLAAARLA